MTIAEMHAVVARHVAAENARDLEGALATYHQDCFYETPALGTRLRGREQVAMQYAALFGALPDGEVAVEGEAAGPDVLVHWGTFHGTVTGAFLGLPPTGRRIALPFVALLPFKDGLMQGERLFFDVAAFCEQAGYSVAAVQEAGRALRAALAGQTEAQASA